MGAGAAGEPEAGLELIDHGLQRSARAGSRTGYGFMAALRVEAVLLAGRPLEVAAFLDTAERDVHAQGERHLLPYLALARARLALAQGAPDAACRHLQAARELAQEMGIAPVAGLADALAAR